VRSFLVIAASLGVALSTELTTRDAAACGGCFGPTTITSGSQDFADVTDERMLLSVSQDQTTLYDQIEYAGNPASFAWVLPIKGTVDVGLSADVLFDSIDALTATQITGPTESCPPPPNCGGGGISLGCSASSSTDAFDESSGGTAAATPPPVTVTKQENVGPYDTVQLHTTDPKALNNWLTQNGFAIPADVTPVIDAYVSEGFDFLAMKLLPNEGIQAMRPVRVTMPGASLSLPLRMAAIGTGATVGITIWVVAQGRYEPQNFPFFHIDDSQLIWDWNAQASNYTTLRATNEANFYGKGWEIESSIDLNTQTITNAILSGGASVGSAGFATPTSADDDYLPLTTSSPIDAGSFDAGESDAGADAGDASTPVVDAGDLTTYETADDVRAQDIATLLNGETGTVRVTRMRSDISHAAMTVDFLLQASSDQSQLSNDRIVTQSVNAPACPSYPQCSDGGACATSSQSARDSTGIIVTFLGLFGLIFTRVVRVRRRR
jgi:hypothetical protein